MRTRATVLLTATVLLGACASSPDEMPPATAVPTEASSASSPARPASEPTPTSSPDPELDPTTEPEPAATTTTATTTTVTIADFAYAPESVEVTAGGTVTWTMSGTVVVR